MSKAKIKSGYLDYFISFETFDFANGKSNQKIYTKYIQRLIETNLIISAENPQKEVELNSTFIDEIDKRRQIYNDCQTQNKVVPSFLQDDLKKTMENPMVYIHANHTKIELSIEDNIEDKLFVSQTNAIQQLVSMYLLEEQHKGLPTKDDKNRFLLMPVKVYINGKSQYLNTIFTIFKSGYSILHIKLDLEDIEVDGLNEKNWNIPFEKVLFPARMINGSESLTYKKKARCNTLLDVGEVYTQYLQESFKLMEKSRLISFYHLTLVDYDSRPDTFESKLSEPLKDNIYKLLLSPISEFTVKSKDFINELLDKNFFEFSLYYRTYANHNKLISLYSKRIDKPFKTLSEEPISSLGWYYSSIGAVLPSIEIILLMKYSNDKNSLISLHQNMSLNELINLKIKENNDYFLEFSQYYFTYASVRQFTDFLEHSCENFLQKELVINQKRRIEELITLRKEKNVSRFTALSPILTILVTLILSLPTLEQLLNLLGVKKHLLSIYLIINLTFIFFICSLYREPLKEKIVKTYYSLIKNNSFKNRIKFMYEERTTNLKNNIKKIVNYFIKL